MFGTSDEAEEAEAEENTVVVMEPVAKLEASLNGTPSQQPDVSNAGM